MNLLRSFRKNPNTPYVNPIENPLGYLLNRIVQILDEDKRGDYPQSVIWRAIERENLKYGNFVVSAVVWYLFGEPYAEFEFDIDDEVIFTVGNQQKLNEIAKRFGLVMKKNSLGWHLRKRINFNIFHSNNIASILPSGYLEINPRYHRAAELLGTLGSELYGISI